MLVVVLIIPSCVEVLAQVSKRFQMSSAATVINNQIANKKGYLNSQFWLSFIG